MNVFHGVRSGIKAIHRIIDKVFLILTENLSALCLIALFLGFMISVVFRYVFHWSLAEVEEVAYLAFTFLALFAAPLSFKRQSNITFDIIYDLFGSTGRAVIDIMSKSIVIVTFGVLWKTTWANILFYNMKKTPMLKISYMIIYLPFMLVLGAGIYYNTVYLLKDAADLYKISNRKYKKECK